MKLLLDTHTFLWFIEDSPKLSAEAKRLLESKACLPIVSIDNKFDAYSVKRLWSHTTNEGID